MIDLNIFYRFTDIVCDQLFHDLFCALDHGIRNPGKLRDLDTVTLIRAALYDLAQKYDIIAIFFYRDTIIMYIVQFPLKLGQFMIMCGKQCLRTEQFWIADMFHNRPRDAQSVKRAGSTADLI